MAKKKTSPEQKPAEASAKPVAASARPRTPRAPKSQAAAPIDISTMAGTEPLASAADRGTSNPAASANEPSHHEVAEAAYLRYLKRNGHAGDEFNDWVEAERELRSRKGR